MGQRHQTLIRYKNREVKDNDEINICTIHNQDGYGRLPIYALGKIAMFNKHNTSTKKEARNFKSLTDDTCCYIDKIKTILSLISSDYIDGLFSDYGRYADEDENEFIPMGYCSNNDGFLLIDLTKDTYKIHYAFVSGNCEWDNETGKTQYKVIDGKTYFEYYRSWYENYNNADDIYKRVDEFLKFIDENCILMNDEDINIFNQKLDSEEN